jgi:hypothetical protein
MLLCDDPTQPRQILERTERVSPQCLQVKIKRTTLYFSAIFV